jgi:RNAse (barnase) inhibitor barstar
MRPPVSEDSPHRIDLRARLAGLRGQWVHVVHASVEARLRRDLAGVGFALVTLRGAEIRNEATFFQEVQRAFGLPEASKRHWDALREALGSRGNTRLAVLWADFDHSLGTDVQTFLDAILALGRAAEAWGKEDPPRQLEVFLLGSGPGFADTV